MHLRDTLDLFTVSDSLLMQNYMPQVLRTVPSDFGRLMWERITAFGNVYKELLQKMGKDLICQTLTN